MQLDPKLGTSSAEMSVRFIDDRIISCLSGRKLIEDDGEEMRAQKQLHEAWFRYLMYSLSASKQKTWQHNLQVCSVFECLSAFPSNRASPSLL